MKKLISALVLLCAAASSPAHAATHYDLKYKIDFWGMKIGDVHYRITVDAASYELRFGGGFGGMVGFFSDASGEAISRGTFSKGRMIPNRLDQAVFWGEKRRDVFIAYDRQGRIKDYGAKPEYSLEGRAPITDDMLVGDIFDPVRAMVLPVRKGKNVCEQTVRVFDVRERYDLHMKPTDVPLKCIVTPERLGGYKLDDTKAENLPDPFPMTMTLIANDRLAVPYKSTKSFALGKAVIRLSEVTESHDGPVAKSKPAKAAQPASPPVPEDDGE